MAHLGDKYGRIKLLRLGLLLSVITFGCTIFLQINIYTTYLFLFVFGFLSPIRLNLSFIYGSEVFKEKHASIMGSICLCLDSFTMIIVSFYFKYVSKEWSYLYYCLFAITCIPFMISLIMPESPKFLLSKKKFTGARISFNTIARINGKDSLDYRERFVQEVRN